MEARKEGRRGRNELVLVRLLRKDAGKTWGLIWSMKTDSIQGIEKNENSLSPALQTWYFKMLFVKPAALF